MNGIVAEDQTVHSHSQHGDTRFFLDWDAKTQSVVLFASKNQVLCVCNAQLLFLLHNPQISKKKQKQKKNGRVLTVTAQPNRTRTTVVFMAILQRDLISTDAVRVYLCGRPATLDVSFIAVVLLFLFFLVPSTRGEYLIVALADFGRTSLPPLVLFGRFCF